MDRCVGRGKRSTFFFKMITTSQWSVSQPGWIRDSYGHGCLGFAIEQNCPQMQRRGEISIFPRGFGSRCLL
jgi:hypothetical protein